MTMPELRRWARRLLAAQTPAQGPAVPRPRLGVFVVCALLLAAQVVARYQGVLKDEKWFAVHVAVGWAAMAAVLTAAHGRAFLRHWSPRTWQTLGYGLGFLLLFWHFGRMDAWARWFAPHVPQGTPLLAVLPFVYFVTGATVFRLLLPALLSRRLLGVAPTALGLRQPRDADAPTVWPVYVLLFVGVLPSVVIASGTQAFQDRYPLARALIADHGLHVTEFAVYASAYALVFVSGEFFWRGWLVFGVEPDLGAYAILPMLVPYVFAHFGKPMAEALGAILAGSVLGWLALKHRSVWLGVALHYAVALSMDFLAIGRAGLTWHP